MTLERPKFPDNANRLLNLCGDNQLFYSISDDSSWIIYVQIASSKLWMITQQQFISTVLEPGGESRTNYYEYNITATRFNGLVLNGLQCFLCTWHDTHSLLVAAHNDRSLWSWPLCKQLKHGIDSANDLESLVLTKVSVQWIYTADVSW